MKKFYILLSIVFFAFPASDSFSQTNSSGAAAAKPKVELVLGNPSGATADPSNDPNNFLLVHNSFILTSFSAKTAAYRAAERVIAVSAIARHLYIGKYAA
jgi:hypothetical protein